MVEFSESHVRSIGKLCIQIALCLPCFCYAQESSRIAYFVVSGKYTSDYQSQGNSTVAYSGSYDETSWNISQDGLRIIGSSGPNSAIASYHTEHVWLNGPLAKAGGEQWNRSASESIDVYVAGLPGTSFSITYAYSVTVSASDLSSPCSTGYTSAYFQGPQTAHVFANQVGLTPSQNLNGSRTITGVTQNRTIADPSGGTQVYSYAWTLSSSRGVMTGDTGTNGCSPAQFTGDAAVDATVSLAVNGPAPSIPTASVKNELTALQPLLNQWCSGSLVLYSSFSEGQQIPAILGGPACWLSEAFERIVDDPPDPQFTLLNQPAVPHLGRLSTSSTMTPSEADSINALNSNQLQAVAYAEVILISLERSHGAYIGADPYWKQKQDELASQFIAQLGAILRSEPSLLADAKNALVTAGVGPYLITAGDLTEFQTNLATKGFPPSLVRAATTAGAKPDDVVKLQSLLLAEGTASFPKIFPDLLTDSSLIGSLESTAAKLSRNPTCAADLSGSISVSRSQIKPGASPTSFLQTVTLTNTTATETITGPVSLVLDGLNANVSVLNNSGSTLCGPGAIGSVFVNANLQTNTLEPGENTAIVLQFNAANVNAISYRIRVLGAAGIR
jgi:hypothetical protein